MIINIKMLRRHVMFDSSDDEDVESEDIVLEEEKSPKEYIAEGYCGNVRKLIGMKLMADYEDIVSIYKNKEIYKSIIAYRIYDSNSGYHPHALTLNLKMYRNRTNTYMELYIDMSVMNENTPKDVEDDLLNPERLYDYTKRIVNVADDYEHLVDLSCEIFKTDEKWLSNGSKYLDAYLKHLIPDSSLIKWLQYKVCKTCMTPFKSVVKGIKSDVYCYKCVINNEMMKITEQSLNKCAICMDGIEHINRVSLCGDARHTIHQTCRDLMLGSRCPICRRAEEES